MENILNELVIEHFGLAIFLMSVIAIGIFVLIWHAAKTHFNLKNLPCDEYKENLNKIPIIQKGLESLPCEDNSKKINALPCANHNYNIMDLSKTVKSTNEMVAHISQWIMKLDPDMINKLAQKGSPLKMTPVGKILFEESPAKNTIVQNLDFFMQELENVNPKTEYDTEQESFNVLFKNIGHDLFNDIKQYLYYSPESIEIENTKTGGKETIKLSLNALITLMGIYLRDSYLEKHTEIVREQ